LDETYARTLEEIDKKNWEYAHRLFQCVAAASRPLRVNELAEFLAFDFEAESIPTFLADWRPEDPAHTVLSICSSFLDVVTPDDGSPVVQFAHFSVKEYLTSARLTKAKDIVSRFHVSMTASHAIVARACLGVLLHLGESITKDSLKEFPLAEYAAEHWAGHARFENLSSSMQDGMKRLFDPGRSHISVWTWIYDLESPHLRHRRSERPEKARATPLHYAAFCGIHDVAAFLIIEYSQDVNARGFKNETPLHVALRRGHADIALLLLSHGADTKARDNHKRTPLFRASKGGLVEVVLVLLEEHGADANSQNGEGCSPLEWASEGGHVEVARILLEHDADVISQDKHKFTPLHRAHREDISRLLLKHGADANALDDGSRTPLHLASGNGRVGAAQVLLEHGVDLNARDEDSVTPLHLASREGYHDCVRLLLQNGADIYARDSEDQTSFMMAAAKGHHDVMQLLLGYGAKDHREQ
jgi:ankyrin repeat protein